MNPSVPCGDSGREFPRFRRIRRQDRLRIPHATDWPRDADTPGHGIHLYSAYRLPNGNTMIGGGNNNRVLEVNKKGDIVWSIYRDELAGIKFFWITQLQILPNGNVIITNTHTGGKYPQLIEVNRKEEVVLSLLDWETFGNDLCANLLMDVDGDVIR